MVESFRGVEAYSLIYLRKDYYKRAIRQSVSALLGAIGINKYKKYNNRLKRINATKQWNKRYFSHQIKIGSRYKNLTQLPLDDFERIITGSDQVWHNWGRQQNELEYFYLGFVPMEKRACFAPSFGFDEFPGSDIEIHKKGLNEMPVLSCRELSGCSLIKDLTGKEALFLPDPTLCLKKEEWDKLCSKPGKIPDYRYILSFFIGKEGKNVIDLINSFADKNDYRVIHLGKPASENAYVLDPGEFLWVIKHAEYVLTDSFHCTVFSIIFKKHFSTFSRIDLNGMEDRMKSLLQRFDLLDRFDNSEKVFEKITPHQLNRAQLVLAECRECGLTYLEGLLYNR